MNKHPFLTWDVAGIVRGEVEAMREQAESAKRPFDEERARDAVNADELLFQDEWEDLCSALTEEIKKRMPDGYWRVDANNLDGITAVATSTSAPPPGRTFYARCFPILKTRLKSTKTGGAAWSS